MVRMELPLVWVPGSSVSGTSRRRWRGLGEGQRLTDISKDDSILSGGHLDVGLDVAEVVWSQGHGLRLLNQLQVACKQKLFPQKR